MLLHLKIVILFFLKKNIVIPEGARCCRSCVDYQRLSTTAIERVEQSSIQYKKLTSNDVQVLINKWQILFERQKRLDFDNSQSLTDDEYYIFTGLSKIQFNDLISEISTSDMRNSSNRSVHTVVAILLCKLRLDLSNRLLATLFQMSDQKIISRALESARTALMRRFVPYHLGFEHITRRQIIDQHTSTISKHLMCDDKSDKAIIVADGTYIYIQVNNHYKPFLDN